VIRIKIFLNKNSQHFYLCATFFYKCFRYKIVQSYYIHITKVVGFLLRGAVKINIKYYIYTYYKAIQHYDVVKVILNLEYH